MNQKIEKELNPDFAELGKIKTMELLFEGSGFENREVSGYSADKEGERVAISHRLFLEGIDFDLVYTPLKHLGFKVVVQLLGPLYASSHKPKTLSVVIGLSQRFRYNNIKELWEGILAAVKEYGVESLSIDVNPSMTGLSIALSASGVMSADKNIEVVKNTDLICLSGNLGAAYMGLLVLNREKVAFNNSSNVAESMQQPDLSKYKSILQEYLSPYVDKEMLTRFEEAEVAPSSG